MPDPAARSTRAAASRDRNHSAPPRPDAKRPPPDGQSRSSIARPYSRASQPIAPAAASTSNPATSSPATTGAPATPTSTPATSATHPAHIRPNRISAFLDFAELSGIKDNQLNCKKRAACPSRLRKSCCPPPDPRLLPAAGQPASRRPPGSPRPPPVHPNRRPHPHPLHAFPGHGPGRHPKLPARTILFAAATGILGHAVPQPADDPSRATAELVGVRGFPGASVSRGSASRGGNEAGEGPVGHAAWRFWGAGLKATAIRTMSTSEMASAVR